MKRTTRLLAALFVGTFLSFGLQPSAQAVVLGYTNTTVDAWLTPASWTPANDWGIGAVQTNATTAFVRLNIGTVSNKVVAATYDATMGTTIFNNTGSNIIGLVIGSGNGTTGAVTIAGGTLVIRSGTPAAGGLLVGAPGNAGPGQGELTLSGGNLVFTNASGNGFGVMSVGFRGGSISGGPNFAQGTFTIGGGSTATIERTFFGFTASEAGAQCTGTINLNAGGTFSTRNITARDSDANQMVSALNFNGGTLRVLGPNIAAPTVAFITDVGTSLAVNVLSGGAVIDTAGFNATNSKPLLDAGGGGGLTKIGAGTLTLTAANTYNGSTIVSNGVLATTTDSTGGGAYVLADGTTLEVTQNSGGTLSMSSLTLGSNCTNTFRVSSSAAVVSVTTALTNNGTVVVNVTHTALTAGTYPLLDYSATPGIVGVGTFVPGTISPLPGHVLRVTNDVSAEQLQLVVTPLGAKLLSWNTGAGDWDFATTNWFNTISVATDTFTNGSFVTFGDLSASADINVPAAVSPAGIIIANEAGNYSFSGSAIGGTNGLTKSGAYQAWLLSSNSFTGVVQVNSGITVDAAKPPSLVVSNGAALGAGGAGNGTVINSGATVALVGGITVPNEEASIAGAGFPSTGAFGSGSRGALQSVIGSNVWNGNITLSADARIGAQDNASLTVNGVIGGAGSLVIRPASNSVVRLNAQNTWASNTLVFATASGVVPYGTVLLGTNNALPTTTQLLHSNVRLDLNGFNQSVAGIAPGGGSGPSSFIENGAASTTSTFTLANTTNNTWNGNIVDGAGVVAVVKTGPGEQILTGTNTYTGATTVNAGELRIAGRLGNTAAGVSGTGTLSGTGSLDGAVTVSAGGTLSPGAGGVGTLTISNNLSLGGSVLIELNKSLSPSNDVVNVTGTLAYGGAMTVTNLGAALTLGDQFPIFPAGGTGTLAVSGNAGAGLAFDFNEITGVLSVVSSAPSPTTLNYTNVSSGVYQFSWTGPFTLEWQTNSAAVGLKTNWVAYPDISNPVNVTNDSTIPTTFFRLISTP